VRPLPTFTTCVCASIRTCPSRPRAHRVVACPSGSCEGHAKHAQLGVRLSWSAPPCADASCLVAAVLRSRRVRGRDALRLRQGEVFGGGMVTHSIGRWSINAACEALNREFPPARWSFGWGVSRAQHWLLTLPSGSMGCQGIRCLPRGDIPAATRQTQTGTRWFCVCGVAGVGAGASINSMCLHPLQLGAPRCPPTEPPTDLLLRLENPGGDVPLLPVMWTEGAAGGGDRRRCAHRNMPVSSMRWRLVLVLVLVLITLLCAWAEKIEDYWEYERCLDIPANCLRLYAARPSSPGHACANPRQPSR
jgi:hypothetical protein